MARDSPFVDFTHRGHKKGDFRLTDAMTLVPDALEVGLKERRDGCLGLHRCLANEKKPQKTGSLLVMWEQMKGAGLDAFQ